MVDVVDGVLGWKVLEVMKDKMPPEYQKKIKKLEDLVAFAVVQGVIKQKPESMRFLEALQAKKIVVAGDPENPLQHRLEVEFVNPENGRESPTP